MCVRWHLAFLLHIKKKEKKEEKNIIGRKALFRKPGIRMWTSNDESELPVFTYRSTGPAGINFTLETLSPASQLGSSLGQTPNYINSVHNPKLLSCDSKLKICFLKYLPVCEFSYDSLEISSSRATKCR